MKRIIVISTLIVLTISAAHASIEFQEGTFGTVAHSKVDPVAVAEFQSTADAIEAGATYDKVEYLPAEMAMWKDTGGVWAEGGMGACMTTISGLSDGDLVRVEEDWLWRENESDPYESFLTSDSYYQASAYTHNDVDTLYNWINYIKDNGDDTFTFVKTTAFFEITDDGSQPDLPSLVGIQYKLERSLTVFSGAALVDPLVSGRGYTYGYSITGGTEVASYNWTPVLTIVPEPATLALLGLGGLLLRKRH